MFTYLLTYFLQLQLFAYEYASGQTHIQTDKQTNRHTDALMAIFFHLTGRIKETVMNSKRFDPMTNMN